MSEADQATAPSEHPAAEQPPAEQQKQNNDSRPSLSGAFDVSESGDSSVSFSKAPQEELEKLAAQGDGKLSVTSQRYDVGQKGYLTPAEQHMRGMDQSQRGYLTNEQVAEVVEQTMEIREANVKLRNYVLGLLAAVIVLGLTNLASAFAAARLAKETDVNNDSGVLYVKGSSSTVVVTQSLGSTYTAVVHAPAEGSGGVSFVCVSNAELEKVYVESMQQGIDTSMVLETNGGTADEQVQILGLSRTGSYFNDTHVVLHDLLSGREIAFDMKSNLCNQRRRRLSSSSAGVEDDGKEEELHDPDHASVQRHTQQHRRLLCAIPGLCPPPGAGGAGEDDGRQQVPGFVPF